MLDFTYLVDASCEKLYAFQKRFINKKLRMDGGQNWSDNRSVPASYFFGNLTH